jgi:hypothetical protein
MQHDPGGLAVSLRILVAALGSLLLAAPAARAEHVVTDMEAGKLTFDALTATPRPIYRPIMATRRLYRAGGHASHAYRTISYRRPFRTHLSRR